MVKLNDIDGVMVEKEKLIKEYENEIAIEKLSGNVVKEAMAKGIVMGLKMTNQGNISVGLNREKLAIFFYSKDHNIKYFNWYEQPESLQEKYYMEADDLIASEATLIERKI